ncbi:twin-arginine translocation protein TatC [Aquipluma nitroreducens]|uniref:Sec-independent protein translocase protein TatC n=1 Tax=Aquipluma nitroreducens TaxID=2010828 RepID=A0A5K7SAV1_9BACT|nr:twin-arginine translocase subunit TatC [Aquipluma nitroreducens]BBE18708.1 twin-arginine translocation protein TatC [Aquipluma nitroreducens]
MAEETNREEQSTKKKSEPKAEMSFLDHLEALRWHFLKSISAIIIGGVVAFIYSDFVWNSIILAPNSPDFWTSRMLIKLGDFIGVKSNGLNQHPIELINFDLSGQFMVDVWTAIIAGFIVAFPYVVYQFWSFIKPALYENERRHASGAVAVMSGLFLIGVLFGYFLIVPFSLDWLGSYSISKDIVNQINILSYISSVTSIVIAGGISFELPVVVYFLSKVGLLTPKFLRKYRKHSYVVLLIIAAIITPPDVLSQMIVTIPLVILYEVSIFISANIDRAHQRKLDEN